MSSQRVSRGFHRLGLLLATVAFLICGFFSVVLATHDAGRKLHAHQELICARDKIEADNAQANAQASGPTRIGPVEPDLKSLGCSEWSRLVSLKAILDVREEDFSYASALLIPLSIGLLVTLAISLAIYGLVRAIGWVIGGFAAS